MSRILVLSVIVASLSTIVGCAARGPVQSSTTPASITVAERDEECWTPPSEIAMSINEAKAPESAATATAEKDGMKGSLRPNRQDRPSTGAVHAASY